MEPHQIEAFALAKDRAKSLEQLIPGTEDHYFYTCLLHEQNGRLDEIDTILAQWTKRHGETSLWQQIRHRLALLRYDKNPKDSLEHVRYHNSISFDHQRAEEGGATDLPTRLDPGSVSRVTISEIGFNHSHEGDLSGFTDPALEWLIQQAMDGTRLRSFLQRIRRPDYAKLVDLVHTELKDKHSSGFGALPIHALLLPEQLEKLAQLKPDLMHNNNFVYARLAKLQPGPDVDWQNDAKEREKYLGQLWDFVKPLSVGFNSLKAHVLFHRLDHDRHLGIYDRARFMEYVAIPRHVSYANPEYIKQQQRIAPAFSLGTDYRTVTLHSAVGNDEELVRDYLAHFFVDAADIKPFDTYMETHFLKTLFATTKILHGVGDMEKWYSLLNDPGAYQALKDRVDINFVRTNRNWFRAGDDVTLEMDIKNVPTLVVKVFEINALNYFLANGRDIDTSVDLDGLVASDEQSFTYDDAPARLVRRSFPFPVLSKPGVYVVEFIGGGISSRALVRKGRARFLDRVGSAGHAFTILDEDRKIVKDASLWLGGREYKAESDGTILVPYSTAPTNQPFLIRHGDITTLETFHHQGENYHFVAGLYVDRESLVKKKEAQIVLRPSLLINGIPAALALIEEPTLVIQSTDRDGVSSSMEVRDFKLFEDKDSVHTFQVPENLAAISFTFRGKVQNLSLNTKIDVTESRSFQLNGIDAGEVIEDLHLARTEAGYVLHLYGKSGEPKTAVAVNLNLRHRDITPTLDFTLGTDKAGRIDLGHLRDITHLTATSPLGVTEAWTLPNDRWRIQNSIHVRANEPIRIPFMETEPLGGVDFPDEHGRAVKPDTAVDRDEFSLLEKIGGTYLRDRFTALSRKDGYLEIEGLTPGDYDLWLKRQNIGITVRVAPGEDRAGWVAGGKRHLERRNPAPLQVSSVKVGKTNIKITLGNTYERTRVHVYGTRFVPAYSSYDELARAWSPAPRLTELFKAPSNYVSGRDIGDEYRYILERKYSSKFAGNMLGRPGLLLNPWAVRKTETATQEAQAGSQYAPSPPPRPSASMAPAPEPSEASGTAGPFANLDFLANPAGVLLNLKPDKDGVVTIPREDLAHANQIRIVAVDPQNTVVRDFLLPEVTTAHNDLRLRLPLDADKHFTEKKQVSVLGEGDPLEIADITTSKTEIYDTLSRVYRLFSTLSNNDNLRVFGFVARWPDLKDEEKRARYSEFACHELSFFLSRKDPAFFKSVILPYLRNKKEKTFLDRYLLNEDLSDYRKPWAFGRLNIVERILLAQRIDDEGDPVGRHVSDLNDLTPRDVELANRLFDSAIQSSALEAGDDLGILGAVDKAERKEMAKIMLSESGMGRGGPGGAGASMDMAAPASMAPRRSMSGSKAKKGAMKDEDGESMDDEVSCEKAADMEDLRGEDAGSGNFGKRDMAARNRVRQFYQKIDKTQEWAENNYYRLTIDQMGPDLVKVNPFWRDYAKHKRKAPFLSQNLAYACNSFTEMMFALSVLDLPFEASKPTVTFQGAKMKLVSKDRTVAYHKEIKPATASKERVPVLVSQNYFRDDDRFRYEGDEQIDNYVTGEFLINVVYVCQVVMTNPTSGNQKLDLLMQIPAGAIPVRMGFYTKGKPAELSSYATESMEYAFYFPTPGTFAHFPVHVAKNEMLIASADPMRLKVVKELSTVDKTSWAWVSQNGDPKDVLKWLQDNNADRIAAPDSDGEIKLELIAWRMGKEDFYKKCIALLRDRHIYNNTLWSYSVNHDDVPNIKEWLQHQDGFLDQCGVWLQSPLVHIDPVVRHRHQHLEYAPLVNARSQKLGARRRILNNRFSEQYGRLMSYLQYRAKLNDSDWLAVAYYQFLQDRIEDGLEAFEKVNPRNVETELQYEYLRVYADFYREKPGAAREIAERHKDHPVDRWRNLFRNALAQIDEITGTVAKIVDDKDRDQKQAKLSSTEPDFEFTVEKKEVTVNYQNLSKVKVNYYQMDIELLFSRQPFVQQQSGQFSFIRPNMSKDIKLPAGKASFAFDLPKEYHGTNVIVEVVTEGRRKSQAYYAHELLVQVVENYGRVKVAKQGSGKPLPKTYVKVYARDKNGEVKFYKDGYTDLRGMFEYTSLSTNELDSVEKFAILILSEDQGAVIREADPPKQ